MIGFLRGVLAHKEPPFLLIDVGGVGYEVEAPMSTCFRLPATGEKVQLCTHLLIREDHHTLFGFSTEVERRLFRDLLKVSGVGAKTALGVLSGLSVEAFIRCVETDDVASLVRLPGVGRKTAERLIIEMRDRFHAGAHGLCLGYRRCTAQHGGDARDRVCGGRLHADAKQGEVDAVERTGLPEDIGAAGHGDGKLAAEAHQQQAVALHSGKVQKYFGAFTVAEVQAL